MPSFGNKKIMCKCQNAGERVKIQNMVEFIQKSLLECKDVCNEIEWYEITEIRKYTRKKNGMDKALRQKLRRLLLSDKKLHSVWNKKPVFS